MNHAVAHKRLVASRILPGVDAAMSGWPQGGVRGQRARVDLSGTSTESSWIRFRFLLRSGLWGIIA